MDATPTGGLFPGGLEPGPAVPASPALPAAPPRLRSPDRKQVLLRPCALEDLIGQDHDARIVWDVVGRWDLGRFLERVKARGESPGRAAIDPRLGVALWLFAYTRGVSNGRELGRLCREHDAFRWLCGGVSVNYHTLNDFRVDHRQALDGLLTQMIAALISQDLVKVHRISTDGTRVRAGAGRSSFKARDALERHLEAARAHVAAMNRQADDPTMGLKRKKAAERAARQRAERIEKAMDELAKVEAAKAAQKDKPSKHRPAKASTTDPEARQMRMPGGGTAPAYNVQFAVANEGRAVVAVGVTNAGSDVHEATPMREQAGGRAGLAVEEQLVDGGYIGLAAVDEAAAAGTTLYAPVPKPKKKEADPHAPKKTDTPAVAEWRRRMGTEAAKELYKERAATVETVNGECKTYRGLTQVLVRGIEKVKCVALWSALAYNLVHFGRQLLA